MNDHLNLLPMSVRRRNRLGLRLRQWSVVWIAVTVLCIGGTLVKTSRIATQRYSLSKLEEAGQPLRETQQQLEQNQQRLKILRSRESLLAMLDRMEQPVQLLGIIGRSVGGERPEVQVYDLILSPTQIVQVVKSGISAAPAPGAGNVMPTTTKMLDRVHLKIDGFGIDDLAVARFVAGLREAGVFESVALKSSIDAPTMPSECRQFSVECVFQ